MDMPKPQEGIGHAVMRPAQSLTDLKTPIVPILINCYYAPQPTAARCYQVGRAVREIVEEFPGGLRIAIVGSGGLWHTPRKSGRVAERGLRRGAARPHGAGRYQGDGRLLRRIPKSPTGDASQDIGARGSEVTGMPGFGGPQGGTRETCNWIAAAGAVEGTTATIVDRVPIYASPIDAAFAYFNI